MVTKCERLVHGSVISDHIVQLFDTQRTLARSVSAFLAQGFESGDALLVVARPKHWTATATRLERAGYSPGTAMSQHRLTVLDASATLASFMRRGSLDARLFEDVIGSCVGQIAARSKRGLRIYGEMVDLLAEERNLDAAHQLEELWNGLAQRHSFRLLCGYASAHFIDPRTAAALTAVCAAHTRVDTSSDDALGNWVLGESTRTHGVESGFAPRASA